MNDTGSDGVSVQKKMPTCVRLAEDKPKSQIPIRKNKVSLA